MAQSRPCVAVRMILRLVGDVLHVVAKAARSHAQLAAENLFLRKQLAMDAERRVKPRRIDDISAPSGPGGAGDSPSGGRRLCGIMRTSLWPVTSSRP